MAKTQFLTRDDRIEKFCSNRFIKEAKLPAYPMEERSGGTFGFPDRLFIIDGIPLPVEFKVVSIRMDKADPILSFSDKHGWKPAQVEFFRRWQKDGGEVAFICCAPAYNSEGKSRKKIDIRYFYRYNPERSLMRSWKRGWHIGRVTEIDPLTFIDYVREDRIKRSQIE